jgi:soluble lytic murein transglycosylase-like protein
MADMAPQIRDDHIDVTSLSSKLHIALQMSFLAKRPEPRLLVVACALYGAIVAVPAARADVMEIGPHGAVWKAIANRPEGSLTMAGEPLQANFSLAENAPEETGPEAASAALTTVDSAAGPQDWQPHIAVLARKYDVSPLLLEAVVWQESRWNTRARSPAGARGLAQLMPGTARQLGVDSSDPYANLEGGARYLRMQLDHFGGDVEKALAAYNAGPGRVERANGIPRIRETREYVASIMTRLSQPVRR